VLDRLRYFCTMGLTLTGPRQGYVALAARDELNPQLLLELLDLLAQTELSDVASVRGETEMKLLGKCHKRLRRRVSMTLISRSEI
jgi:hypothetical protein